MAEITRRDTLKKIGATGLSLSALATSTFPKPAIAQGNTTITVSTWGGVTEEGIRKLVQPKFVKLTKASILYDIGGQGARYNKLLAQRASPPADVFFSTDEAVVSAYQQGILVPASRKNIPNAANVAERMMSVKIGTDNSTISGVPYTIIAYLLAFNPKTVTTRPTSWADMWRPEFANKFAFASPVHTQMPSFVIIAAELAGGSIDNIDPGFKKLAELRPSKLTVFWTDWAALYKSGDVIAATEFSYYLETMKAQNYDIDYVNPSDKGIAVPEYASIVKGTKKQELSEVFLNLMLDPEVQTDFARFTFQGPTNNLVHLPDDIAGKCTYGPIIDQLRFFDPQVLATNRPLWTERMNTQVVPHWRA